MQQSILSQTPHRQHHTQLSSLPSHPNAEPAIPKHGKFQNPIWGHTVKLCIGYLWLHSTLNDSKIHPGRCFCRTELLFESKLPHPKRISIPCYCWQPKWKEKQVGNIQVTWGPSSILPAFTMFAQVLCLDKENSTKSVKSFEFLRQKKFWKGQILG